MAPAAGDQLPGEAVPPPVAAGAEQGPPVEAKSVKALTLISLKRTFDLFVGNHSAKVPHDEEAQKAKIACKASAGAAAPSTLPARRLQPPPEFWFLP